MTRGGLALVLVLLLSGPSAAAADMPLQEFVKRSIGEQTAYVTGMTDALIDMSGLSCPDSVSVADVVVRLQYAAQQRVIPGDTDTYLAVARVLLQAFHCTFPDKSDSKTAKKPAA